MWRRIWALCIMQSQLQENGKNEQEFNVWTTTSVKFIIQSQLWTKIWALLSMQYQVQESSKKKLDFNFTNPKDRKHNFTSMPLSVWSQAACKMRPDQKKDGLLSHALLATY